MRFLGGQAYSILFCVTNEETEAQGSKGTWLSRESDSSGWALAPTCLITQYGSSPNNSTMIY